MEYLLKLAVSFFAGFLSFLTPCVLPLVPSYITFIGGTTFQEMNASGYNKKRLFIRALFFISGFTVVFVIAGIFLWGAFSLLGELSAAINTAVNIIAGSIIILLGLNIIFDFIPLLFREAKIALNKRPENNIGALAAGMAFGAGWSPCIGPLLGGIITLTATSESVFGIINLIAYSLGLGVPFLLLSLAFASLSSKLEKIKKYFPLLKTASGLFLILIGFFIVLGQLVAVNAIMTGLSFFIIETNKDTPWLFPFISAVMFLAIGAIPVVKYFIKIHKSGNGSISPGLIGSIWFVVFMALAVLQIFGLFPIFQWISEWLLVQELVPIQF